MVSKLNNIQALRAFAVLLVVGLHILAIELKYSTHEVLLPEFLKIGISGVDLFFVISGFIMVAVTANPNKKSSYTVSSPRFIYLRLSRIYPLYWLVTLSIIVAYHINSSLLSIDNYSAAYAAKSLLLLPQKQLPLLMVGWSLIHEVYFYFVFTGFLFLPRKYLPILLITWAVIVVVTHSWITQNGGFHNNFTRIAFSPITLEFIAGCYIALFMGSSFKDMNRHLKEFVALLLMIIIWSSMLWCLLNVFSTLFTYIDNNEENLFSSENILLACEFLIMMILVYVFQTEFQGRDKKYPLPKSAIVTGTLLLLVIWNRYAINTTEIDIEGWTRVYLFTPSFCLLIYGAVALERNSKTIAPEWMIKIGDASYSIYLSHILIISALGHIWALFTTEGYMDNIGMIILMTAGVIVGGLVCYHVVERKLLRASHILADNLFGKKKRQ